MTTATLTKYAPLFTTKAIDETKRTVSGLASAWALDDGGDVITRGAYAKFLERWKREQFVVPLLDSHGYDSVMRIVGKMTEARETAEGLDVEFEVLRDDPTADAVFRRVQGGFVDGLSIGYHVVRSRPPSEELKREGALRVIEELELREISVVTWPMNERARITDASGKALNIDADRPLTDEERKAIADRDERIRLKIESILLWEEKNRVEELARLAAQETRRRKQLEAMQQRAAPLFAEAAAGRVREEQARILAYTAERKARWALEDAWDALHEEEAERMARRAGRELRRVLRHMLKGEGAAILAAFKRNGGTLRPHSATIEIACPTKIDASTWHTVTKADGTVLRAAVTKSVPVPAADVKRELVTVPVKVSADDLRVPTRTEKREARVLRAKSSRPPAGIRAARGPNPFSTWSAGPNPLSSRR